MGEEMRDDVVVYMNGEPFWPLSAETELVPDLSKEELSNQIVAEIPPDVEFSCSVRARFPHVTRKQFIAQLEKAGYSRKQAKDLAWDVQKRHGTYSKAAFFLKLGVHPQNCH